MDVALLMRRRLRELKLEQKDLAIAADVTESYISQLLARKKTPPAPGRSHIYDKIGRFLKLPPGQLSRLAEAQRLVDLKKKISHLPRPVFENSREALLAKCAPATQTELKQNFEKDAFGDLERIVLQTIFQVVRATEGVTLIEAPANSEFALELFEKWIDQWTIDLMSFDMEVHLSNGSIQFYSFSESIKSSTEQGLIDFLQDKSLSGDASDDELFFLKTLSVSGRKPTSLFFYRALQNLRDPLHFFPDKS